MLLKKLSELNGTSGAEGSVRDFLRQEIQPYVDRIQVDKIGNLLAFKNSHKSGPKVMVAAHMDEVALMIMDISSDGFLKFQPVGGIDPRTLISKPVRINQSVIGVIGTKAIHLQKSSERRKSLRFEQLSIDIGAKSKDEAFTKVKPGDYAYFLTEFEALGEGLYKGKALDDRVGCAILAELLKRDFEFPLVAAFTVQEEVGLRGAKAAAYQVAPDFALVIEGTAAADLSDAEENWSAELGKGPACSLIDSATLYDPQLIRWVGETARRKGIPLQYRRGSSGGNDAGSIHLSRTGVPTIALSVPCRYLHSPVSLLAERDYRAALDLVTELLKDLPRWFDGSQGKEEEA